MLDGQTPHKYGLFFTVPIRYHSNHYGSFSSWKCNTRSCESKTYFSQKPFAFRRGAVSCILTKPYFKEISLRIYRVHDFTWMIWPCCRSDEIRGEKANESMNAALKQHLVLFFLLLEFKKIISTSFLRVFVTWRLYQWHSAPTWPCVWWIRTSGKKKSLPQYLICWSTFILSIPLLKFDWITITSGLFVWCFPNRWHYAHEYSMNRVSRQQTWSKQSLALHTEMSESQWPPLWAALVTERERDLSLLCAN